MEKIHLHPSATTHMYFNKTPKGLVDTLWQAVQPYKSYKLVCNFPPNVVRSLHKLVLFGNDHIDSQNNMFMG